MIGRLPTPPTERDALNLIAIERAYVSGDHVLIAARESLFTELREFVWTEPRAATCLTVPAYNLLKTTIELSSPAY